MTRSQRKQSQMKVMVLLHLKMIKTTPRLLTMMKKKQMEMLHLRRIPRRLWLLGMT